MPLIHFSRADYIRISFSDNPKGKNIGEQESCNYIDPSKPIVFLVHGFISSANNTNNYDLASQLVKVDILHVLMHTYLYEKFISTCNTSIEIFVDAQITCTIL